VHLLGPTIECRIAMKLTDDDARTRLTSRTHGVLATLHAQRGVDAVPVVYVADGDGFVGVPIDRVKPKTAGPLQRERNLAVDPRATLLVEHWDPDDWSQLWWVRAELRWLSEPGDRARSLAESLARTYPQYRDRPFDRVLVFRVDAVAGWAAAV
jgi:PPOX class probable F420-dependent enzyme